MVLNERAEALKEEIAVGLRQAQNLERLREVAAATGHAPRRSTTRSADGRQDEGPVAAPPTSTRS